MFKTVITKRKLTRKQCLDRSCVSWTSPAIFKLKCRVPARALCVIIITAHEYTVRYMHERGSSCHWWTRTEVELQLRIQMLDKAAPVCMLINDHLNTIYMSCTAINITLNITLVVSAKKRVQYEQCQRFLFFTAWFLQILQMHANMCVLPRQFL